MLSIILQVKIFG